MTTLMDAPASQLAPWSLMPGWGVVADLTPPELIEMRRLRGLRKIIAFALAGVLALCIAGYVLAMLRESDAQDALDQTRSDGVSLTVNGHKYAGVTALQSVTKSINDQISQLMTSDVDVAALLQRFRVAVPNTMSLTSVNVSLSNGAAAGATTTGTAPAAATSPLSTGQTVIGSVTMSGSSTKLVDLAGFVDTLQAMRGVTDVLPPSNTSGTGGTATWSITLSLTDKLYTHKYKITTSTTGGK